MIRQITTYQDEERGFLYQEEPIEESVRVRKIDGGYLVGYLVQDQWCDIDDLLIEDENCFLVHYHRDFWIEKEAMPRDVCAAWYRSEESEEVKDLERQYYIFPVSALIHSGVYLQLGDCGFEMDPGGWDTSHVGAVLVSRNFAMDEEAARDVAGSLICRYNLVLSGSVFCYVIERYNKDKKPIEIIDHVCGYVAEVGDAMEELEGVLNATVQRISGADGAGTGHGRNNEVDKE